MEPCALLESIFLVRFFFLIWLKISVTVAGVTLKYNNFYLWIVIGVYINLKNAVQWHQTCFFSSWNILLYSELIGKKYFLPKCTFPQAGLAGCARICQTNLLLPFLLWIIKLLHDCKLLQFWNIVFHKILPMSNQLKSYHKDNYNKKNNLSHVLWFFHCLMHINNLVSN